MRVDTTRLDNFTDAAFAFALSLLVIGASGSVTTDSALRSALADVPAYAIGFGIVGNFWYGHVRWRHYRGDGALAAVLLTLALLFVLLIYIRPLQAMSASLATFMGGSGRRFEGDLAEMFTIYGMGFSALSAIMAALFLEARHASRDPAVRRSIMGEALIWAMLAATGLGSVLLCLDRATAYWGPWAYATLPVTVGLFAAIYPWPQKDVA